MGDACTGYLDTLTNQFIMVATAATNTGSNPKVMSYSTGDVKTYNTHVYL
jgi:hypothetical protein